VPGRWTDPDRSSAASEQKPPFGKQPPTTGDRFAASLQRFAETHQSVESTDGWHFREELGTKNLAEDPKGKTKRAVKTLLSPRKARYFEWESTIHAKLNHPLIVGFKRCIPGSPTQPPAIVTEFVANGSLADHLPVPGNSKLRVLTGGTRIAIIVAGMVLAMRYLHSRGIIHRDLKRANVLLDWDWIVRIGDFSSCLLADEYGRALPHESDRFEKLSVNPRYAAPECFENDLTVKSDVFLFGIILCELLSGLDRGDCSASLDSSSMWIRLRELVFGPAGVDRVIAESSLLTSAI
jgi:serine/threonine protein kinase